MTTPEPVPAAMTAAGFQVARERLGLTTARLAEIFGVGDRAVKKWGRGEGSAIPPARVVQLHELEQQTQVQVDEMVRELRTQARAGRRPPVVTTYENDEQYQLNDGGPWSASWHRAVVGRAIAAFDRPVVVEYATDQE